MTDASLIKKLLLKPGMRVLVLNAPPGYLGRLGDPQADSEPSGQYDFVQVFTPNSDVLAELAPVAAAATKHDGLLWLSYPKLTSKLKGDLSRDRAWEWAAPYGLRPVTQVSVDDTWSALRFRPAASVGA